MECGLVGDGEFVGSHGQAAPLPEPIDTAFGRVALPVRFGVEGGRPATGTAASQAVSDLVRRLRDASTDPASTWTAADRAGRVRAVRQDRVPAELSAFPARLAEGNVPFSWTPTLDRAPSGAVSDFCRPLWPGPDGVPARSAR